MTEQLHFLSLLPFEGRDFPGGSDGKESTCNEGDLSSIPGLGRSPEERKDCPLHYSGLENSMDCSSLENPRDRKPGRLPSMGSHRVGHD